MMAKKTGGVNTEKGQIRWPDGQAESPRKGESNLDRGLSALRLFVVGSAGIFQRRSIFGRFILCHSLARQFSAAGLFHYTKGNFQFERTVVGWRERYTLLDLRRK